ncbi:MAG: energy-coupling factor transporter transmembrane protein EcfT [Actinomycetales bacterium]|jgi:energy-coupling factor transport system permease protein|nr:energy-coupling factor transporter transmembrane protein EcfT [Actinomycetales bacterium]
MTAVHPLAWWAWAMALAVAAARTPHAAGVAGVLVAVVVVVALRARGGATARLFPGYLVLGAAIVVVRLAFHVLVGLKPPGPVLLDLPTVRAPEWAQGIQLLGPVTTTGLGLAAADGLRLATLVVCFGAAAALADPRRVLRAVPAAMHHLGTAVVVAVSVTPQLATAAAGVRRAQRLRGAPPRGWQAVRATAVPVLADALDRSLALAASMDVRGYARSGSPEGDRRVGLLLAGSLVALGLGAYGLLAGGPAWRGAVLVVLGAGAAVAAGVRAGRRVRRTRYRPDAWGVPEWLVAGAGVVACALLLVPVPSAGATGLALAGGAVAALPALGGAR